MQAEEKKIDSACSAHMQKASTNLPKTKQITLIITLVYTVLCKSGSLIAFLDLLDQLVLWRGPQDLFSCIKLGSVNRQSILPYVITLKSCFRLWHGTVDTLLLSVADDGYTLSLSLRHLQISVEIKINGPKRCRTGRGVRRFHVV